MTSPKNILVFGATGGTGQQLVAQALRAGYGVNEPLLNLGNISRAYLTGYMLDHLSNTTIYRAAVELGY